MEVHRLLGPIENAVVHPRSREWRHAVDGPNLTLRLERGENVALEIDGHWLYLFASESCEPSGEVLRFAAGEVHTAGEIVLRSGQTLWIEPGAVLRAAVRAHDAENITIGGGGVLDNGWRSGDNWGRPIVLDGCRNVTISDLTIVRPQSWMVTLGGCEDVEVRNLHEIGATVGSDGIDVAGSRRVRIHGGLLRNNDDCVVVKSIDARHWNPKVRNDWSQPVHDVVVENLTVANDRAGNGLEVGHELRTPEVRDITFRNIDILHVHGHGAPFSINAGDRATVRDVTFEDIRVWHHYDKLINCRVMRSRFNRDPERGQIRDVVFRNIRVEELDYNPGYTVSVIGGWDAEHTVEGVTFERFFVGDRQVMSLEDLDAFTRHASGIVFR